MDESTVKRAMVFDKVQEALLTIPELDDAWKVLLVSAGDRRDQQNARTEIRIACKALFEQPNFDTDVAAAQILLSVIDYIDGEEKAGL